LSRAEILGGQPKVKPKIVIRQPRSIELGVSSPSNGRLGELLKGA
jgi:hypothetical protein